MKYKKTYLIIIFMLFGINIFASECCSISPFLYDYELSTIKINALTQDKSGRIWIASSENLYCFDGYNVEKIHVPRHKAATSHHVINSLYADSHNRIWLALGIGICCYDPKDNSFTYKFPQPSDMLSMSNVVYNILEKPDGTLLFATRNGIFYTTPKGDELQRFMQFPWHEVCIGHKSEERIALCMHIDQNGALWVGTGGDGVLRINMQDGSRIHFKHIQGNQSSLCDNNVFSIFEDQFGVMWFGTTGGLSMFKKESTTFVSVRNKFTGNTVNNICSDEQGNIFAGTERGLAKYDRKTNQISWLKNKRLRNFSPYMEAVSSLLRDRSGQIWVGSTKGLAYISESDDFTLFGNTTTVDSLSTSSLNSLRFLLADNHSLWIGCSSGEIMRVDPTNNSAKNYTPSTSDHKTHRNYTSAYLTRKNELVIGTTDGLLKFNPRTDCFEPFSFLKPGEPQKSVYAITESKSGDFWIGILDEGVFHHTPGSDKLNKIPISFENIHKNIYTNTKILHEDGEGNIWIVFWRAGILRHNPHTGEERLFTQENTNGQLLNNTIWDLKEDEKGRLLLATAGGLCKLDPKSGKFINDDKASSLLGMSIVSIVESPVDNLLWLSTTNGVIRFDPKSGNVIKFSEMDGLQGSVFTSNVRARIDSLLFFGGENGLNIINTNKKFTNSFVPVPRLLKIIVNDKIHHSTSSINDESPFIIDVKCGDQIEIFFSSFSFRKEWRNNFHYKIIGQDTISGWIIDPNVNSVKLPELKNGTYTFEVTASNCDGVSSPAIQLVTIKLTSKWPTYAAAITAILALIVLTIIYQKRIYSIIARYRKRKKNNAIATKKSKVDSHTQSLLDKLTELMVEDKMFCNKRLTKSDLAGYLRITEQQLAQLLSTHYNKSFPEFVNTYRVEAVKQRLREAGNRDYTLLALGEECGFNSKSSFYRVFKEFTKFTPAEYLEQINK